MLVNQIQENPLGLMRHSLHNDTLTWRLFGLTCFPLIPTAHGTFLKRKISCIVQLDNPSVGAAMDLFMVVTQSQKRFHRITLSYSTDINSFLY